MSLSNRLKDGSGSVVTSFDDHEILEYLVERGLASAFKRLTDPTDQVLGLPNKTHHIIAVLCLGRSIKTDNGYSLIALPKSQYSDVMAADTFCRIIKQCCPSLIIKGFEVILQGVNS